MRRIFIYILPFIMLACDKGEFSNGVPNQQAKTLGADLSNVPAIYIDGTENKTITEGQDVAKLLNGIRFDPGNLSTTPGEVEKLPLDIYFVLDVTASMKSVLDAIKNNIQNFAANLSQEFRPMFGGIAFRDSVTDSVTLTPDVNVFREFVARQVASKGGDQNEAALLGLQQALSSLTTQSRPEATKAVLVITDNPGHSSSFDLPAKKMTAQDFMVPSQRDCNVLNLVSAIRRMPELSRNLLQIYHSTGSTNQYNLQHLCSGFQTAEQQISQLIAQGLGDGTNINANIGGRLSFPFNSNTLVNEFSERLKRNRPAVQVACIAESAQLLINGQPINAWRESSLAESFAKFKAQRTLDWRNPVPENMAASLHNTQATLQVRRCCLATAQAEAGDFSSCEYKVQEVDFTVYQPAGL